LLPRATGGVLGADASDLARARTIALNSLTDDAEQWRSRARARGMSLADYVQVVMFSASVSKGSVRPPMPKRITAGQLVMDTVEIRCSYRGHDVPISKVRFQVLAELAWRAGFTVTYGEFQELLWPERIECSVLLRAHISHIRQLLGIDAVTGPLQSVFGVGFRWCELLL
jgi:DNA-binding response OmpR family regulator